MQRAKGPKITSVGVALLGGLSRLETLVLPDTNTTDAACVHIGKFQSLRSLDLRLTRIGDAGLTRLQGLNSLRHVQVKDAHFATAKGLEKLRRALPNCRIE